MSETQLPPSRVIPELDYPAGALSADDWRRSPTACVVYPPAALLPPAETEAEAARRLRRRLRQARQRRRAKGRKAMSRPQLTDAQIAALVARFDAQKWDATD